MPNWCITDCTLIGSAENTQAAYDALQKLEDTQRPKSEEPGSFLPDSHWLGYIVEEVLNKSYYCMDCRGTFYGHSLSTWQGKPSIVFSTETAWAPCEELLKEFAMKFGLSLNFYSQEPGSVYYVRFGTDGVYPETLYYNSEEDGEEFYVTLEDFLRDQGAKYGLTADATLDDALKAVNASEDDMLEKIIDLSAD